MDVRSSRTSCTDIALSFNGRTPDYESEDWGSSPCEATKNWDEGNREGYPSMLPLANWLSLRTFDADIAGSSPVGSAFFFKIHESPEFLTERTAEAVKF